MTAERASLIDPSPYGQSDVAGTAAPAEQPQVNIFRLIHRNLRGRYILAGTLAAIFGLAGAAAGYFIPVPKYRAEGWLDIRSTIVQATTDQTSIMPMFTNFVNKQVRRLQDDRVLQKAMKSEEWKALGRPNDPEALVEFRSNLSVAVGRDAQDLVLISFTDQRADAALHGLRQTVLAYQDIYSVQDLEKSKKAQSKILGEEIARYTANKRSFSNQIANRISEFAASHGTDDFLQYSDRLGKQLFDLKDRLAVMRLDLIARGADPDKIEPVSADNPAAPAAPVDKTAEEIASLDPGIAQWMEIRNRARQLVNTIVAKGRLPQHPERIRAEVEFEEIDRELTARVAIWNANPKPSQNIGATAPVASLSDLKAVFSMLSAQADSLGKKSSLVNKDRAAIVALQTQLKDTEAELDLVTGRNERMALDSAVETEIGRVDANIPDKGDIPTILNADPRRKFAMLGLIAGAGFPVGLLFLFGLVDRRYRYADQADSEDGARLLGILPDLPTNNGDDPATATAAVHAVHHIRSKLQIGGPGRQVYMVTSPTSGDGKTSLALSLAVSFTASGAKVLLIDFDLIGHGLTYQLDASCPRGIGQRLVDGDFADAVIATQVPGLSLIAAGSNDAACASRVSRKSFAELLTVLRPQFDTIIIDSGPILGSLEANLAASLVDAVIVVVRRGQQGSYIHEATQHLRQMGASLAGIVFNRARVTDFNRSSSINASFRSIRPAGEPDPNTTRPADVPGLGRLGALARRVAIDAQR